MGNAKFGGHTAIFFGGGVKKQNKIKKTKKKRLSRLGNL